MKQHLQEYLRLNEHQNPLTQKFELSIPSYDMLIGICVNCFLGQLLKILNQGQENTLNQALNHQFLEIFKISVTIDESTSPQTKIRKALLLSIIGQVWDNQVQKDSNLSVERRVYALK